ncbi:hypothetical protein E8E12_008391 [Didymella heteroderae]|uniref:Uncharacterized protein n=1 Tax=Didymella heteroderae TaxID=1769908 RepID=A0A9P4WSN1_9PLEO|nr:hypothetical protein E8E12_008391 [Didymella heteroderae]
MSLASRIAFTLLIFHALLNIAQGVYCVTRPTAWLQLAPSAFEGAPDAAVQAIGLGALGIGWYQLIFAWQGNRALVIATIPLRLVFAAVVYRTSGWGAVAIYQPFGSRQQSRLTQKFIKMPFSFVTKDMVSSYTRNITVKKDAGKEAKDKTGKEGKEAKPWVSAL